jgi:hypothetical protein
MGLGKVATNRVDAIGADFHLFGTNVTRRTGEERTGRIAIITGHDRPVGARHDVAGTGKSRTIVVVDGTGLEGASSLAIIPTDVRAVGTYLPIMGTTNGRYGDRAFRREKKEDQRMGADVVAVVVHVRHGCFRAKKKVKRNTDPPPKFYSSLCRIYGVSRGRRSNHWNAPFEKGT